MALNKRGRWRMVKSETCRDAETLVSESETEVRNYRFDPRPALSKKRDLETGYKKIRDFEIRLKVAETHNSVLGTIRHPLYII